MLPTLRELVSCRLTRLSTLGQQLVPLISLCHTFSLKTLDWRILCAKQHLDSCSPSSKVNNCLRSTINQLLERCLRLIQLPLQCCYLTLHSIKLTVHCTFGSTRFFKFGFCVWGLLEQLCNFVLCLNAFTSQIVNTDNCCKQSLAAVLADMLPPRSLLRVPDVSTS